MAPRRQRDGSTHTPTLDESGEAERIGETARSKPATPNIVKNGLSA